MTPLTAFVAATIISQGTPVEQTLLNNLDYEVPRHVALSNLRQFAHDVAHIESDLKPNAKNPNSTAKGYFQYIDGSFKLAKKRAHRMGNYGWLKYTSVTSLSYTQQVDMFYADLYQRRGTDGLLSLVAEGNTWAAKKLYKDEHHTNPDKATITRMNSFIQYKNYLR